MLLKLGKGVDYFSLFMENSYDMKTHVIYDTLLSVVNFFSFYLLLMGLLRQDRAQSPLAHLQGLPSEHWATRLCVFSHPSPVIHGISCSPHSTDKRTEAQAEEVTRL